MAETIVGYVEGFQCECPGTGDVHCVRRDRFMPANSHRCCKGLCLGEDCTHCKEHLSLLKPTGAGRNPVEPETISLGMGILNKAGRLARAVKRHAAGGFREASPAEKARRAAACQACPRHDAKSNTCTLCGCNLKLKQSWATERCPDTPPRWDVEPPNDDQKAVAVPDEDDLMLVAADLPPDQRPIPTSPVLFRADWSIGGLPKLKGKVGVILGGGPSLADSDLSVLDGRDDVVTLGLNNVARVRKTDLWMCVDEASKFPEATWADPDVLKVTSTMNIKSTSEYPNTFYFVRNARFRAGMFFAEPTWNFGNDPEMEDELGISGGRSVMLPAVKLLAVSGCSRIVILGADFHMDPGRPYAHGEPKSADACESVNRTFRKTNARLTQLLPVLMDMGIQVYNATPGGRLAAFPRKTLAEAIA